MALERPYEAELETRHLEEERLARRDDLLALLRTVLALVLWACLGLFLMGNGLHTRDRDLGRMSWLAGQTVWLGGILFTLILAYRRMVRGNAR